VTHAAVPGQQDACWPAITPYPFLPCLDLRSVVRAIYHIIINHLVVGSLINAPRQCKILHPSIYRSHFRIVRIDHGKINSASERSYMQTIELIRLVRGAAYA
jgi:hypothetical protein